LEKLTPPALTVLKKRYLLKDKKGRINETPHQLFSRVARALAPEDKNQEKKFLEIMANLDFLPNSPTLMNAGTSLGQLAACFVLPVEDSLTSIFDTLKYTALIQQSGGGTGFSFSKLRPRGDMVQSTHGVASGPVSFIHIFNSSTDVVKQGGRRRGANIGILSVDHPDILEFIEAKKSGEAINNFNLSVSVTDQFMRAAQKGEKYKLIHPRTEQAVGQINARKVFDLIAESAWKTGDPGLLFINEINRRNPTPKVGKLEATNPCGEVPLLPFESCNLGSINLKRMLNGKQIDWEKLAKTVKTAVDMLDATIDVTKFPLPQIAQATLANRKIGLGVMGFADLLIKMGIPYNSEEALNLGEALISFIEEEGHARSQFLGRQKGNFPNFPGSIWQKKGYAYMRNATVTTIAPTGTLSLIADCSSGIEPIFATSYVKKVLGGIKLPKKHAAGPASVTAHGIMPEWHVRMQAAFQKFTDNAVSKTVNLPFEAKVEDVRKVFWLAYDLKCKGITVYRDRSKKEQVLYTEDIGEQCCSL